jgi:hypothetical protein
MASAALPPAGAHHADADVPGDCDDALRSALGAAEASLLAVCALATPVSVSALSADRRALLRRVGALSAELCTVKDALLAQQPAPCGAADCSDASRQRQRVEFSSLPHALVVRVLAALPVDARLRCAEVCRTWRAAVSDRSLWLRVDLSRESGVTHEVTHALLRAVAARAAGRMQALVLPALETQFYDAMLHVVQTNSASLRELETVQPVEEKTTFYNLEQVVRMLRAAPQLQVFRTDVEVFRNDVIPPLREAVRMLRNEAPFGLLRVRLLCVLHNQAGDQQAERFDDADLLALFAAISEHVSLKGAWLEDVPLDTPAVLDAFIDAALARRICELTLERCSLSPASIPAFVRLLGGGALTRLFINGGQRRLWDVPAALLLADALRANTTLRMLQLAGVMLWADTEAGVAVTTALTAHPSLHTIVLRINQPHANAAAAGAALGALVAVNALSLQTLDVSYSSLGDAGLAPLFAALPHNTHLRELYCEDNGMTAAFAHNRFLPAVRANTSLRELMASGWFGGAEDGAAPDEVLEAEALVKARADADAAASDAG